MYYNEEKKITRKGQHETEFWNNYFLNKGR